MATRSRSGGGAREFDDVLRCSAGDAHLGVPAFSEMPGVRRGGVPVQGDVWEPEVNYREGLGAPPWYHLAQPGLPPGVVLPPGRWGARVLETPNHPWRTTEVVYETVRQIVNPSAPSRLGCAFAHPELSVAVAEQQRERMHEAIYEVVPLDVSAPVHVTNLAYIHPGVGVDLARFDLAEWTVRYWVPTPAPEGSADVPEVLVGGPLQIVGVAADATADWPH